MGILYYVNLKNILLGRNCENWEVKKAKNHWYRLKYNKPLLQRLAWDLLRVFFVFFLTLAHENL